MLQHLFQSRGGLRLVVVVVVTACCVMREWAVRCTRVMVPLLGAPFRPHGSTADTPFLSSRLLSSPVSPFHQPLSLPPSLTICDLSRDHARPLVLLLLFLFHCHLLDRQICLWDSHARTHTHTHTNTHTHAHTHTRTHTHTLTLTLTHTHTHTHTQTHWIWSFGMLPNLLGTPTLLPAVECTAVQLMSSEV